jgi:hypothetical protein
VVCELQVGEFRTGDEIAAHVSGLPRVRICQTARSEPRFSLELAARRARRHGGNSFEHAEGIEPRRCSIPSDDRHPAARASHGRAIERPDDREDQDDDEQQEQELRNDDSSADCEEQKQQQQEPDHGSPPIDPSP